MYKKILIRAAELSDELKATYRELHKNAEVGFELTETLGIVKESLKKSGVEFEEKKGFVTALIGKNNGKTFLLRADMDALPMREESGVDFSCKSGNFHACGHDMHTAMLLGAAKILKENENILNGRVKLLFQPAEETLTGAKYVIKEGVLKNPQVDGAMMIHVMTATPFETGTVIVSSGGVSAPSADYFTIRVNGKGGHGSSPHRCVDPISAAAHIVVALQEISAREIAMSEPFAITIGKISGGTAANIIPDSVELLGSVRCFDEQIRQTLKCRITEISEGIAKTFRASASVTFDRGCPSLVNDEKLSEDLFGSLCRAFGGDRVLTSRSLRETVGSAQTESGSEDFSYISREVPSVMVAVSAGKISDGYTFSLHNKKVRFDEKALSIGAAAYAVGAVGVLGK